MPFLGISPSFCPTPSPFYPNTDPSSWLIAQYLAHSSSLEMVPDSKWFLSDDHNLRPIRQGVLPASENFFQQGGEEGQKAMPWTPKFRRGAMEMDRERSHCLWTLLAKGLHLGSCCLSSTSGGGEWKLPTAKHHDPPLPSPGPRVKLPGHQAVPGTRMTTPSQPAEKAVSWVTSWSCKSLCRLMRCSTESWREAAGGWGRGCQGSGCRVLGEGTELGHSRGFH
nr:uncharacterized protein LOC103890895 isoform X1 [Pongo abelii]